MIGKTKIEYLDYTWNFYPGCLNWKDPAVCGGGGSAYKCWAKSMADRFGRDFTPALNVTKLFEIIKLPRPARVGVCFTGDLFGPWVDPGQIVTAPPGFQSLGVLPAATLRNYVHYLMEIIPQAQFFFKTKCPENLAKWGKFPDNAWVGVTATDDDSFLNAYFTLANYVYAKHKYISLEPWLGEITPGHMSSGMKHIDWLIIGGLSNKPADQQPKVERVRSIVSAADKAGVPVFLKNNLGKFIPRELAEAKGNTWPQGGWYPLRQEVPA